MYDDSYPSRPPTHRPRRSRPRPAATMSTMEEPQKMIGNESLPPQHQQHHQLSPSPSKLSDPSQIFDFFYSLIFSFVHSALLAVLSPVMGSAKSNKRPSSTSRRRVSPSSKSTRSLISVNPSYNQVEEQPPHATNEAEDPEMGQQQQQQSSPVPQMPPIDNSDCMSVASHSSQRSGVLHTQPSSSRRRDSDLSVEKKVVRFPAPERKRIPLGRVGFSVNGSSSHHRRSSNESLGSNNSSSEHSSSSSNSRRSSIAPTNRRRTLSPFKMNRMAHSSYFLE